MILLCCSVPPRQKAAVIEVYPGFFIRESDSIARRHVYSFSPSRYGAIWVAPNAFLPPCEFSEIHRGSLARCLGKGGRVDYILTPSQDDDDTALIDLYVTKTTRFKPDKLVLLRRQYSRAHLLIQLAPDTTFCLSGAQYSVEVKWTGTELTSRDAKIQWLKPLTPEQP